MTKIITQLAPLIGCFLLFAYLYWMKPYFDKRRYHREVLRRSEEMQPRVPKDYFKR